MTVSYLPFVIPRESRWEYRSNSAAFRSPLSGAMQTVARPGGRWFATITYPPLAGANRARMKAFFSSLDGHASRFYVYDYSYSLRGSVGATELVSNWNFISGVTGWQSTNGSNVSVSATGGGARLKRLTSTNASLRMSSPITTVIGQAYSVAAVYSSVRVAGSAETADIMAGNTAGATTLLNKSSAETSGRLVGTFTATATSTYVGFGLGGTGAAGSIWDVHSLSVAKSFLVNGASQTGSLLAADGAATSQTGLLLEGDFIEVPGSGLHMVTADVDSDGSGNVYIPIKPSLRASPTNNDPVVLHMPSFRAILSENAASWTNKLGGISDFSLEAMEIIE